MPWRLKSGIAVKFQYLPNILTIIRLLLAGPITLAILSGRPVWTISLFGIAALSDALDGFLARRYGWQSRLGAMLDPLADKVLLVSAFLSLTFIKALPLWLTLLVVGRDILIIAGTFVYHWVAGSIQFKPSRLGKLCTLLQLSLIMTALVSAALSYTKPVLILQPLVALFTIGSGLQYVVEWGKKGVRRIRRHHRG
ncbi:CDP-alcohol phosphatidyltransferase family protein [Endozoicomonas atrinae]|uniref:CDP-alcohol phosphatidyltransferase family protein n=1 Tax=Endozoicomonas atrinae TaxID=1333660 RepID=UPI003AFFDAF7